MDIQQAIEKILNYNWGKLQDELPTGQTKYDQRQRSILFSRIDDNGNSPIIIKFINFRIIIIIIIIIFP